MLNQYKNMLPVQTCEICPCKRECLWRKISFRQYPEQVQLFVLHITSKTFWLKNEEKQWYADYKAIQEQLVWYYDSNNCKLEGNRQELMNETQRNSDREKIKKMFKDFLDTMAKATEEKNPELSIFFDGIGFVLASDYLEAVSKIFSMLKTAVKRESNFGKAII